MGPDPRLLSPPPCLRCAAGHLGFCRPSDLPGGQQGVPRTAPGQEACGLHSRCLCARSRGPCRCPGPGRSHRSLPHRFLTARCSGQPGLCGCTRGTSPWKGRSAKAPGAGSWPWPCRGPAPSAPDLWAPPGLAVWGLVEDLGQPRRLCGGTDSDSTSSSDTDRLEVPGSHVHHVGCFLPQAGETHLDLRVIVGGAGTAHIMASRWVPFSPLKGGPGQSPCGRPGTPCPGPPGNCSRLGPPWSAGSAIGPRLHKGARRAQGGPLHDPQTPYHPALAASLLALAKKPRALSRPPACTLPSPRAASTAASPDPCTCCTCSSAPPPRLQGKLLPPRGPAFLRRTRYPSPMQVPPGGPQASLCHCPPTRRYRGACYILGKRKPGSYLLGPEGPAPPCPCPSAAS